MLCSACSGIFLLAETGLFDGKDATVHFGYAREFAATYPVVPIHPERVLVISGLREELISSGASTTWHDMVLYLIARFAGATDAQEVARMYRAAVAPGRPRALHHLRRPQRPRRRRDRRARSSWLSKHFSVANPVEEMIKRSKLAERTFKRRFTAATGLAPIAYVQRLRIEDAKRRLERTDALGRRDQLARRLRRRRLLPAPVQAHHGPGAGRVSQAVSHSRVCPPVALRGDVHRPLGEVATSTALRGCVSIGSRSA